MQGSIAVITIVLLITMVIIRSKQLKKLGIKAFKFGEMDKKDFIIPPFALLLFYLIFANAFNLPRLGTELFRSESIGWIGVVFCLLGLLLFLYSLISFGKSFRVGIDEDHPGPLITTGAFAISRNPIYTAFGFVLLGEFLIYPNWILLVYLIVGYWLFNRQVLLEEQSLMKIYGEEYKQYSKKVRRYL
ncbi:protein-S-isoprenylcysteine O-methyltransferase Ste14 [Lysinibacillus composti]|uniref:Isoprenylcysteine carboxylmethyltransferase family protein n=1 Tax=Lysinibacillus composti TaxID=720633 RepID=A0A3N9UAL2_9BACI|nr:isoprenylcysteine carboxylmethyltransferase family protein [Lysinibacillus composti]MBM7609774.1 protein-S-isoprenylcysteine O-methyltransferase Ste14 [Lysinibacillus composti]RQW73553.1 isoprenylcysteine carboxylmethyltransferase family protein [Lysinibacillus composti]